MRIVLNHVCAAACHSVPKLTTRQIEAILEAATTLPLDGILPHSSGDMKEWEQEEGKGRVPPSTVVRNLSGGSMRFARMACEVLEIRGFEGGGGASTAGPAALGGEHPATPACRLVLLLAKLGLFGGEERKGPAPSSALRALLVPAKKLLLNDRAGGRKGAGNLGINATVSLLEAYLIAGGRGGSGAKKGGAAGEGAPRSAALAVARAAALGNRFDFGPAASPFVLQWRGEAIKRLVAGQAARALTVIGLSYSAALGVAVAAGESKKKAVEAEASERSLGQEALLVAARDLADHLIPPPPSPPPSGAMMGGEMAGVLLNHLGPGELRALRTALEGPGKVLLQGHPLLEMLAI